MDLRKELDDIWRIYLQCQSGNVDSASELFESRIYDDTRFKVVFKPQCLSALVDKIQNKYKSENKIITGKHKKYFDGEYDVSDASEMVYMILLELFTAALDSDCCATINNTKSNIPIVDAESLLKNLSYFTDVEMNKRGSIAYLDVCPDMEANTSDSKDDEQVELSLFDIYSYKAWESKSKRKRSLRRRMYADILKLMEHDMDAVVGLFKSDSVAILAIIKTILECDSTYVNDGDDEKMVTQEQLCDIVKANTGRKIEQNNIPLCFQIMRTRIMDYKLFSANKYYRLFGAEEEEAYARCKHYISQKRGLMNYMHRHKDLLYPILNDAPYSQRYDMVNLLQGDYDVLSDKPQPDILMDIAQRIVAYYEKSEESKIAIMLTGYTVMDRFVSGKSKLWNTYICGGLLQIRFYSNEQIKYPVIVKIPLDALMVIEGAANYYICDSDKKIAYILPKTERKRIAKTKKEN